MKNKTTVKLISIISAVLVLTGIFIFPVNFQIEAQSDTENIDTIIDKILYWKYNGTKQELLEHEVAANMGDGISEWYVVALSRYQNGLDFSSCVQSLDSYITAQNLRATDKQRIAIAYTVMGVYNDFVVATLKNTIGSLGIMSYIYGLILTDCGSYTNTTCSREDILDMLLSLQNNDGGWALTGTVSDVDVTAMAVQAMARYNDYAKVKISIDKALSFLSQRQKSDGDFQSYGTPNAESTAQVMMALNALNINYKTDKRFIKNGKTVYDGMMKYQCTDGGFSHIVGTKSNAMATVQILCALVSIQHYEKNLPSFFAFMDNRIDLSWERFSETSEQEFFQPESSITHESQRESLIPSEPSKSQSVEMDLSSIHSETEEIPSSVSEQISSQSSEIFLESSVSENAEPIEEISNPSEVSLIENKTSNMSQKSSETEKERTFNGRLFVCIGVVGIFGAVLVIIIVRKKVNRKNLLVLIIAFVVVIVLVLTTNIQSKEEYYTVQESNEKIQTVTVSILCTNAVGKTENSYLPSNGIILNAAVYGFENGDTVFDVLLTAVKEHQIQIDYTGSSNNFVYIKGINYLYEFDCGELSGWMYKVNGKTPSVGCSSYTLHDGDMVEWIYTCNIGKDLGE